MVAKKRLHRICGVCNCESGTILHKQMFVLPEEFHLDTEYDIVSCDRCGFVYARTLSNQKDFDRYYSQLSKYENASECYSELNNTMKEEKIFSISMIEKLNLSLTAKIVEIGCGNGIMLKLLHDLGYKNILGIDPSSGCVSKISDFGIPACTGFITDNNISPNSVDLLILEFVFEHLCDLNLAIKNVVKILKPTGKLLISIPDAARYHENYVTPFYYFDSEHINHFSIFDIDNLAKIHGLKILDYANYKLSYNINTRIPTFVVVLENGHKKDESAIVTHTSQSVLEHVRVSNIELNKIKSIIDSIDKKYPVVIWGAGNHTFRILAYTALKDLNIVAFIDNDPIKQGLTLNGVKIYSKLYLANYSGKIILCTAFSNEVIEKQIIDSGLQNKIVKI